MEAADYIGGVRYSPKRFGIEARTGSATSEPTPMWDVTIEEREIWDVVEVKSGKLSKDDRLTFWRRLKRELAFARDSQKRIRPVLVLDSGVDPVSFKNFSELTMLARESLQPPSIAPERVTDAAALWAEAIWFLTKGEPEHGRALTLAEGEALIESLRVEGLEAGSLESDVNSKIEILFPNGLSEQTEDMLLGWLNSRATSHAERRFITLQELLAAVGIQDEFLKLKHGVMRKWREMVADVGQRFSSRAAGGLGRVASAIDIQRVQPQVNEAIHHDRRGGLLLLGMAGAGKTIALGQIANLLRQSGDEVVPCAAEDLSSDEIEEFVRSCRFQSALKTIREPSRRLTILVDALDEAEPPLRKRWGQLLARLAERKNILVVVTMREGVWGVDATIRGFLGAWEQRLVKGWSDEVIREVVGGGRTPVPLTSGLMELLRQPLMLDIFCRTILDQTEDGLRSVHTPTNRHQLLASYWSSRVVVSTGVSAGQGVSGFESFLAAAASHPTGIPSTAAQQPVFSKLLSESVIIKEGGIHPRFRFRHPLLRDFALAWWCLNSSSAAESCARWQSVAGGLQQQGVLRAILEALEDESSAVDLAHIRPVDFLASVLSQAPGAASSIALTIGSFGARRAFDPANWPNSLQQILPPNFAREILNYARISSDASWAEFLARWKFTSSWIDDQFVNELLAYASALGELHKQRPHDTVLLKRTKEVARRLREATEHPRFSQSVAQHDRWIIMSAQKIVISQLPDEETLEWIERELLHATWRTRSWLLEELTHVAHLNPNRVAAIYEKAVGLSNVGNRPTITVQWSSMMDHQAIEWSLAGEGQRRSLLREFAPAFMPVAFRLIEAFQPEVTEDSGDGLIEDHAGWRYWEMGGGGDYGLRCTRAVHQSAKFQLEENPDEFFTVLVPLFRASRTVLLRTVFLDVLFSYRKSPQVEQVIVTELLDSRAYHHTDLYHWIDEGINSLWPTFTHEQRQRILGNIEGVRESAVYDPQWCYARLLGLLPDTDLTVEQRMAVSEHFPKGTSRISHPQRESRDDEAMFLPDNPSQPSDTSEWPPEIDPVEAAEFSAALHEFEKKDTGAAPELVSRCLSIARKVVPALLQNHGIILTQDSHWVWSGLTKLIESHHKTKEVPPPECIVADCGELALRVLETTPHGIPDGKGDHWPSNSWTQALKLADADLVWPPLRDDSAMQSRFMSVLEAVFAETNTTLQVAVACTVRDWHWLRTPERKEVYEKWIWDTPRAATVMRWFLRRVFRVHGSDSVRIVRKILSRADLPLGEEFMQNLGQAIGMNAIYTFVEGTRSKLANLLREILETPTAFEALRVREQCISFFSGVAFGLREQAKLDWGSLDRAAEYGEWNLRIWAIVRPLRTKRQQSENVILFAMHWLEQEKSTERDQSVLRVWWENLFPLFRSVVEHCDRPGCYTLLFNLRDGAYNHLIAASELFELMDSLVCQLKRLGNELDLDATAPERDEYASWREVLGYGASALDSLRTFGTLRTDGDRERCRSILAELAAMPLDVPAARTALHKIQTDYL